MKTKNQQLKSLRRAYKIALYNASINLDRHNCLHPDRPGCGHQFEEYRRTWLTYLSFMDEARRIRRNYEYVKESFKPLYFGSHVTIIF